MSKVLKWILAVFGVVVVVLIGVAVVFALTFDPNAYRDDITGLVRDRTGRDLEIEGELQLTFFPWLGFEVGTTVLGPAPGFGDAPFARFDSASAKVKLLPLLTKQIELGKIELRGLVVRLEARADGTTSWDDLAALGGGEDTAAPAETSGGFTARGIGGVELRDAQLLYRDGAADVEYRVDDWDLVTGALAPGQPSDVDTSLVLSVSEPAATAALSARGKARYDGATSAFSLARPDVTIELSAADLPFEPLTVRLEGDSLRYAGEALQVAAPQLEIVGRGGEPALTALEAAVKADSLQWTGFDAFAFAAPRLEAALEGSDLPGGKADVEVDAQSISGSLDSQSLSVAQLRARTLGLEASGSVTGSKVFDDPGFRGDIRLAPFNPRALMERLEMAPYETADPEALTSASLSAQFRLGGNALALEALALQLDETTLTGTLRIADIERQALRFDLTADTLVMDRYMAPVEESAAAGEQAAEDDLAIPTELLRGLDVEGTLRVGQMVFAGIRSSQVEVGLSARDGQVRVFPSTAQLYGGSYNGDIRIDASRDTPRLSLNESLAGVAFGDMSRDLYGVDRITGTLDGEVQLTGDGETISALQRTLNGQARFEFTDGAFEGRDLSYEILRALALVERKSPPPAPEVPRTEFRELRGSATVTDGVMRNDDLILRLPVMRAEGDGTLDLPEQAIDYRLRVTLPSGSELAQSAAVLSGKTIPVKIGGTFASPTIAPDIGAVLQARVQEEVEQLKEKAADKLRDRLGIGGKGDAASGGDTEAAAPANVQQEATAPDAAEAAQAGEDEPKDVEDELKDKARRKLKDLLGGDG